MRINGLALRTQNINTWLLDKLLIYPEMHGISGAEINLQIAQLSSAQLLLHSVVIIESDKLKQ